MSRHKKIGPWLHSRAFGFGAQRTIAEHPDGGRIIIEVIPVHPPGCRHRAGLACTCGAADLDCEWSIEEALRAALGED